MKPMHDEEFNESMKYLFNDPVLIKKRKETPECDIGSDEDCNNGSSLFKLFVEKYVLPVLFVMSLTLIVLTLGKINMNRESQDKIDDLFTRIESLEERRDIVRKLREDFEEHIIDRCLKESQEI